MSADIFAYVLTKFIPGTMSEVDYCILILGYLEMNKIQDETYTQMLLSKVDYGIISKSQLCYHLIPSRIEIISPILAIILHDISAVSSPNLIRCVYSGEILTGKDGSFETFPCGCTLSDCNFYLPSIL